MPYIDWNGHEQEDGELDNMRADRREEARQEREEEHAHGTDWAESAIFDAATLEKHAACGPACPVQRALAAQEAQEAQEMQARVNKLVNNLPTGYGSVKRVNGAAREAAIHYGYTGLMVARFQDMAVNKYRERLAQERAASAPMRCIKACYTVGYDGEVGYFPRYWSTEGTWRAIVQVGFFELVVLAFPTYQEALAWIAEQP